jgi:HEAT repeat protein
VPAPPKWGTSPRKSVEAESERQGKTAVVAGCRALLAGREADPRLILALGGRPARWAAGFDEPAGPAYWLRVWAARGLLWAWGEEATPSILAALSDDSWRVREMATRVVSRHHLADALPIVKRLRKDPNARVRKAAERAVALLSGGD